MTREQCEQQILEEIRKIAAIAKEYNPDTNRLFLSINVEENTGEFNNCWYKDNSPDKYKPIKCRTNYLISKASEENQ